MIPAIGAMIGAYIITRMLDILTTDKKAVIKVFACLTIIVTLFGVIDIMNAGTRVAGLAY
jgi:hypothetical protein